VGDAKYFRESNGLEADLLIHDRDSNRRWVVDAKAGQTPKAPWIEAMAKVSSLVKNPKAAAGPRPIIIYRGLTKREWPTPGSDFLGFEDAIAEWQTDGS